MTAANKHYLEPSTQDKAIGAYLGLAIGDAFGATVEFLSPDQIKHQIGVHQNIIGGGWLKLAVGQITDDTSMSLALGEAILVRGEVDASTVAQAFSNWFANNPVDVGNTVKRGLVHFRHSGIPYVAERLSDAGNGACMRTLPVALATYGMDDAASIRIASRDQAHVTHNNPLSDAATECVIEMIHMSLAGCSRTSLLDGPVKGLLNRYPEFNYGELRREMPSGFIVQTMQAVLQAFFTTNTFEDCLVDVVNRGGDADTTGAIAGMIAGCYYGVQAIPARWLSQLDSKIATSCELQAKALLMLEYGG